MEKHHLIVKLAFAFIALVLAASPAVAASPQATSAPALSSPQRLILRAKSAADYAALRQDVLQRGAKILIDQPAVNLLVISSTESALKATMTLDQHAASVGSDHIEQLVQPSMQADLFGKPFSSTPQLTKTKISGGISAPNVLLGDPAFSLPGLMWNVNRISAPKAWVGANGVGMGLPFVKVAVEDTGLDYTHVELANKVVEVHDFTLADEYPYPICATYFGGISDSDIANFYHVNSDLDFNGHGSWIGGNIASALNVTGTNGIAPNVELVSLKISQWCGAAYDSTILDAFIYAADHGIDIVSISFGGYVDRTQPDQDLIYQDYVDVVAYARSKGTLIVAAAGNEHTRIGAGGQVLSHGTLTTPGSAVADYFGWWETPGGVPGVVDVASTGNVVNEPSATCPADSIAAGSNQWCKLSGDAHQPSGVGMENQLAYYSNYGPRIDIAAPGGARKFNLPYWDGGGTPGWPQTGTGGIITGTSTADGYNAWEDFSITSNYAQEIPCYFFEGSSVFPDDQCYSIIQGTSMATPHVSAVLAIIASSVPGLWRNPDGLVNFLKTHADKISGNATPVLNPTDTLAGDISGPAACTTGYCHLGGNAISDAEAYGAGLVDASGPFWAKVFIPAIEK